MSVIYTPPRQHPCQPGWRSKTATSGPFAGQRYGIPPSAYDFPEGTAWECECGRIWVSTGPVAPQSPGFCAFRPERRRERKRRERASLAASGHDHQPRVGGEREHGDRQVRGHGKTL